MGKVIELHYAFSEAYSGAYKHTPYHHVFQEQAFRDLKWEAGTHVTDFVGRSDGWNQTFISKRRLWSNKTNTSKLQGWTIGWEHHNLSVTARTGRLLGLDDELKPKDVSTDDVVAKAIALIVENMTMPIFAMYSKRLTKVAHAAGYAEAQQKIREVMGIK